MVCPKRKNIRLAGYDYSQRGGYFLTICTDHHKCMLSAIYRGNWKERARVELTHLGRLVENTIFQLAEQHGITIDSCIVMPNHIHMIVFLPENRGTENISVGRFVGAVKSVAYNRYLVMCKHKGIYAGQLWQRNYYDHILRNERDYLEKRKYIEDNPDRWIQNDANSTNCN